MLKYFKIKVSVARFSASDKPSFVPTLSTNTVLYDAIFVLLILKYFQYNTVFWP